MSTELKMPTEVIELPSKGLLYASGSALATGNVEMKYMTAKEEDILTNISYIKNNTMFDKLLQSLIVSKVDFTELLVADRDALLVAARVLGYGKDYSFRYINESEDINEEITVDLSELNTVYLDESLISEGKNEFQYTLPSTGTKISFKLLTVKDEKDVERELQSYKKINPTASPELSTRLKKIITSVNGDATPAVIRDFVDNHFLAMDSRKFRKYLKEITPGIELKFNYVSDSYTQEGISIDLDTNFFWPES